MLAEVVNRSTVSEEESHPLLTIVSSLSTEDRLSNEMQALLQTMLQQANALHTSLDYLDRIVRVIALLVEVTPVTTTGSQLSSLFAQTRGASPRFIKLHSLMLGHWPDAPDGGSPVDFQPLFNQSLTVLRQYPNTEGAGDILRSLWEMISRRLLPGEDADELVNVACEVWDSQQEAASEVLQETDAPPPPAAVAKLAETIDPASNVVIDMLRAVWSHINALLDLDDRAAVAVAILAQPPISGSSNPDLGLSIWVDVQEEEAAGLLQQMMTNSALNDSQQARVWHQIDRVSDALDKRFFESVLPDIFATGLGEVASTTLKSRKKITERFVGPSARHDLSNLILDAFVRSSDLDVKRSLVSWLRELGNETVLKELKDRHEVDLTDVELLLEAFPTNRSLQSRRRKLIATE